MPVSNRTNAVIPPDKVNERMTGVLNNMLSHSSLSQVLSDEQLAPLSQMRPITLQKIEQAVIDLYAISEDKEVTMQAIAKQANVSLQTLYKYFGDKQTLIYVILDQVLGRLATRMIDHLRGIDSVKDRLRKTLWVMFDFIDTQPKSVLFVATAIPVSRYQNIAVYENRELLGAFLGVLADGQRRGVLNQDVSLKVLLDVFMGFINRLGLMQVIRGETIPMTAQFDVLFEILWRAISNTEIG